MPSPRSMPESASPWCIRFMDKQRLSRLRREIEGGLKELYPEPWLPELTDLLDEWGWQTLCCSTGILPTGYGTGRVLARRPEAPRHVGAYLPVLAGGDTPSREIMIEFLTEEWIGKYRDIGLTFYTPNELVSSTVLECLEDAMDVLARVPTLQKTVAALVRACHILKPEDEAYDVSHSDPLVPFSVWVSVPRKRRLADSLRVAESLVHEAMHLQLTLIERLQPLVRASSQTYLSPWKDTHRSPQGILHALYVFRVLDSFFERLLALPGWRVASVAHMRARRREIALQINTVETFKGCSALTTVGTSFIDRLISGRVLSKVVPVL